MKSREQRLEELTASAERIAGGDFEHRATISTAHDDVDALAFTINVIVGELSYAIRNVARAKEEAEARTEQLARAQENLIRTERLAVLGQLAGGVAHQIRNPLAVIMNATFVLKRCLSQNLHPDVARSIDIIYDEIHHANGIITGLLDFARVRAPVRRTTSMIALVERVFDSARVPESIRIERQIERECPTLDVDADQVREAILNLVRNAVEAMPDGGTLNVALGVEGDWFVVAVTDTGPGIAPEQSEFIFEPLRSTKPSGVGLGLVTARTLIEAHGGVLERVPTNGGARFEVRLPIDPAHCSPADQGPA